jgi:hypothetical protein
VPHPQKWLIARNKREFNSGSSQSVYLDCFLEEGISSKRQSHSLVAATYSTADFADIEVELVSSWGEKWNTQCYDAKAENSFV